MIQNYIANSVCYFITSTPNIFLLFMHNFKWPKINFRYSGELTSTWGKLCIAAVFINHGGGQLCYVFATARRWAEKMHQYPRQDEASPSNYVLPRRRLTRTSSLAGLSSDTASRGFFFASTDDVLFRLEYSKGETLEFRSIDSAELISAMLFIRWSFWRASGMNWRNIELMHMLNLRPIMVSKFCRTFIPFSWNIEREIIETPYIFFNSCELQLTHCNVSL